MTFLPLTIGECKSKDNNNFVIQRHPEVVIFKTVTGYTFQRLSEANIKHLVVLYDLVFHKKVSVDFLRRKYNTKNSGASYIGYIAFSGNAPAAFYGVLPCLMNVNGETMLAAQSADTMTHPGHRKKGLFQYLAQKTYALAKENGIRFIFGFPNQNSYPGFVKLNWQFQPEPLKLFMIRASSLPYAKAVHKVKLLSKFYYRLLDFFISGNVNANDLFDKKGDGVQHNQSFIDYKQYSQTFFARIDRSLLWVKPDSDLKVGVIKIHPQQTADILIKKISRLAVQLGCQNVIFITSIRSDTFNFLKPLIPPVDSLPIGFYNLSDHPFEFGRLTFEYCDIDIF
jgi:hypothetical protein